MNASDPSVMTVSSLPAASATKNTTVPSTTGAPTANRLSTVGPGDRVDDGHDHGQQGQRDHDQQERQLPKPGRLAVDQGTLMAM